MSLKHSFNEQLDGNCSLSDEDKDDDHKYLETLYYWKSGRLSSVYQTYLDANEIIDKSNFEEDVKKIEKEKILEARKSASIIHLGGIGDRENIMGGFSPQNTVSYY